MDNPLAELAAELRVAVGRVLAARGLTLDGSLSGLVSEGSPGGSVGICVEFGAGLPRGWRVPDARANESPPAP